MNSISSNEPKSVAKDRPKRKPSPGPKVEGGSTDARRLAAAILDVLAGIHTPSEAAAGIGTSLQHYYALETRALEGLVAACEPKAKGRASSPEKEVVILKKQVERLTQECARKQALVRAAQRAVGLSIPPAKSSAKRKRRATVRALRAAEVLRSAPDTSPASGEASAP